ncbi:hypothetical protein HGM15179_009775 [Zosterops borbonicus]|uniref:ribonuclease H n=1 Tax=Zosterops borbonicus TaxID=364589 RepID=A0A8K1LKT1_9PASS|nr:hypothetical protein HGM15179_009775 [Zosterops borbonicus]
MLVIGVKGKPFKVPVIKNVEIESETKICLGDMLLMEEANFNLLGRDLIVALGINLMVQEFQLLVSLYKLTTEDEGKIDSKVWHAPGKAGRLKIEPVHIEIERPEEPISVKQHPILMERRRRLKLVIDDLVRRRTLTPCMSKHNTSILAVRKMDGSYRLVQELQAVKERTGTKFPAAANPYTLLNRVSPEDTWYSVIHLKDAFWTCPLGEESQDYSVFQREDHETNKKQQFRWTSLPQSFVDSPNLFGQALEQSLSQFVPIEGTKLLQYGDDLLEAGPKEEDVRTSTIALLNFLGDKGLKVSKSKLQLTEPELDSLQHFNVFLVMKGRKLKIELSLTSAEYRATFTSLVLLATLLLIQARMPLATLACGHTLAHVQLLSLHLFHQETFNSLCTQPVVLPGVVATQGQDPELGIVEPHTTGLSPLIQPVQIPLQSLSNMQHINVPSQHGGVHELTVLWRLYSVP